MDPDKEQLGTFWAEWPREEKNNLVATLRLRVEKRYLLAPLFSTMFECQLLLVLL